MCQMKIKSDQATKFTICDHISKISSSTVYKKRFEIKFNFKNLSLCQYLNYCDSFK